MFLGNMFLRCERHIVKHLNAMMFSVVKSNIIALLITELEYLYGCNNWAHFIVPYQNIVGK